MANNNNIIIIIIVVVIIFYQHIASKRKYWSKQYNTVAIVSHLVTMVFRKETVFPRWKAVERCWNKVVSLVSFVTVVMRLPALLSLLLQKLRLKWHCHTSERWKAYYTNLQKIRKNMNASQNGCSSWECNRGFQSNEKPTNVREFRFGLLPKLQQWFCGSCK